MDDTLSAEQIAQNYTAMGHSVNFLNSSKPSLISDDDWNQMRAANIEHLQLMRAEDYWTDEDMTAFDAAIGD